MVECVRLLATWLADPTDGVNTLLAGVERYAGDDQPPDVAIVEFTSKGWVARGATPRSATDEGPQLAISPAAGESWEAEVPTGMEQDGEAEVLIRYVARKELTEEAVQDWKYTLRALRRSLNRWNRTEIEDRTAHDIAVIGFLRLREVQVLGDKQDSPVSAGIIVTLQVRDSDPLGA